MAFKRGRDATPWRWFASTPPSFPPSPHTHISSLSPIHLSSCCARQPTMSAEVEATSSAAVVAAAADIICSLRGADLAGWTPPWTAAAVEALATTDKQEEELMAWPAVARGKRSRSSRRRSPSRSAAKEGRWARGSPASPLDYSGGSGSGSGASTSGGEDVGAAFCSPPAVLTAPAHRHAGPTNFAPPSSSKLQVGSAGGGRRPSILPVPAPRPAGAGPRSRKKMRLPEVQQLVRSLAVENDGLREQMESLQRACTALSKENGKLETRLEHKTSKRNAIRSEEQQRKALLEQHATEQEATNGFVLPDLNIPVDDMAD